MLVEDVASASLALADCYVKLQQKVNEIECTTNFTLGDIVKQLRNSPEIEWMRLETAEREKIQKAETGHESTCSSEEKQSFQLGKNWKYHLIRSFTTPRRYQPGGDRKSALFRIKKEGVVVACQMQKNDLIKNQEKAEENLTNTATRDALQQMNFVFLLGLTSCFLFRLRTQPPQQPYMDMTVKQLSQ